MNRRLEVCRDRPAQAPFAHHRLDDTRAEQCVRNAAFGGFYLRKFGHASSTREKKTT
jgi:hypothetical protein